WHLRYGDEYTVEKALEFIEKRDGRVETLASKLEKEVEVNFLKLQDEIEIQHNNYQLEFEKNFPDIDSVNDNEPKKMRLMIMNSPSVQNLIMIKRELNHDFIERINLYLTTSEIFRSKPLAVRAREILALRNSIESKMLPTRDGGNHDGDSDFELALEYVQDKGVSGRDLTFMEIDLRLSVIEAQLNSNAETLQNLKATLVRHHKPEFDQVRGHAFSGGDDFCDLGDWQGAMSVACKNDSSFFSKAMAYGYADAMLAILTDNDQHAYGKLDWQEYGVLHQKHMIHNSGQRNYLSGDNERIINLKLALADRHFAKSKAKETGRWSYEEAWQLLAELSLLVNPAENPVRFRQIAERAITVDAMMQNEEKGWQEQHAHLLAYYRLNLRNLDKLAIGDVP
ncbi:MAG: hypothetical protein ABL928_12940, partial [Sphingorhabdus sp.]